MKRTGCMEGYYKSGIQYSHHPCEIDEDGVDIVVTVDVNGQTHAYRGKKTNLGYWKVKSATLNEEGTLHEEHDEDGRASFVGSWWGHGDRGAWIFRLGNPNPGP